jgi:plastocyanin
MGRALRPGLGTAVILAAFVTGCGGGSPSSPSGQGPGTGTPGTTITISASGASPSTLTVAAGTRVTFVNRDSRSHAMFSDAHPDHGDCPALNDVGLLNPGQSRETGNLVFAGRCGFHDHDDPTNRSLQGTIIVQ